MSLTLQQQEDTIEEFKQNLALANKSIEEVAADLHTNPATIRAILQLQTQVLEHPWIVRNYLIEEIEAQGKSVVPFTALVGDYHGYWFLNAKKIDKKRISNGLFSR